MPYARTTWTDNVTPVDAAKMNNIETGLVAVDGRVTVPTVVNGQWLKGVGGAAVWSAITPADVGTAKITTGIFSSGPPSSPADGDIWIGIVDSTVGLRWMFQYAAGSASAYKWEFIGGGPIVTTYDGAVTVTATTYTDLTGGVIQVQRAGDYDWMFGALLAANSSAMAAYVGIRKSSGVADDSDAMLEYIPSVTGSMLLTLFKRRRFVGLAAAETLVTCSRVSSGTMDVSRRTLAVTPVRVS